MMALVENPSIHINVEQANGAPTINDKAVWLGIVVKLVTLPQFRIWKTIKDI